MALPKYGMVNAAMSNELENHRAPFSLRDAVTELNLSIHEFVDVATWAKTLVASPIPSNKTVKIFYENKNLSFQPKSFETYEGEFQADYIKIESCTLKTIALGGNTSISSFTSLISRSGYCTSTENLHERIYRNFTAQNNEQDLNAASRKERIDEFYNSFKGSQRQRKWFSITSVPAPENLQLLRPMHQAWLYTPEVLLNRQHLKDFNPVEPLTQQGSSIELLLFLLSDSLPVQKNLREELYIENKDIFFLAPQIYDLKHFLKTLPSRGPIQQKPTKLEILNSASRIFCNEIMAIKDPSRYWRDFKNSSPIVKYLTEQMKPKKLEDLEYQIRVLANDERLFDDKKPEIAPRPEKYPDFYPDALIRLNEAGDSELSSACAGSTHSKRIGVMLEKLGFKSRAANNLKAILNEI